VATRIFWFIVNIIVLALTIWYAMIPHELENENSSRYIAPIIGSDVVASCSVLQLLTNAIIFILLAGYAVLLAQRFNFFRSSSPASPKNSITTTYSGIELSDRDMVVHDASSPTAQEQRVIVRFISMSCMVGIAVLGEVVSCCVDISRSLPTAVEKLCASVDGKIDEALSARLVYDLFQ